MAVVARHAVTRTAVLICTIGLCRCGGGGGGSEANGQPLRVDGSSVPSAALGHPYVAELSATGGTPPYAWSVVAVQGSPPAGIALDASGGLSGTALVEGDFFFTAQAGDAAGAMATARFAIPVRRLDVQGEPTSELGLLIPNTESVWFAASDGDPVTYAVVSDASGGTIVEADAATGWMLYRAGPSAGPVVVRATRAFGTSIDVAFDVHPDPFATMTAHFGSTDVWWPRFDQRDDPATPYATDLDDALVKVGLRDPLSVSSETRADRLARTYVIRHVIRRMNRAFLNAEDGTATPGGLPITFSYRDPGDAAHVAPPVGSRVLAYSGGYNAISFHYGFEGALTSGTYGLPDPGNVYLENLDGRNPSNALGVHIQTAANVVNSQFSNTVLPGSPIGPADVSILEAMLLDAPLSGTRAGEIRRIAEGLANMAGFYAAHAVGHCLGLQHSQAETIMIPSSPTVPYETFAATAAFDAGEVATMSAALPGPGR